MKTKFCLLALTIAMILTGCEKEEEKPEPVKAPELTLADIADIQAEGGDFSLGYTLKNQLEDQSVKVQARSDVSWIHIGKIQDNAIAFSVDEYIYKENQDDRSATITVQYDTIIRTASLKQIKPEKVLVPELTVSAIEDIPAEGGDFTVEYQLVNPLEDASVKVEAVCPDSWIHITEVKDGKIAFTVDEYVYEDGVEDRSSEIRLAYDRLECAAALKQIKPVKPELSFDIQIKETTCSRISIECTPNDLEATYVLREITKAHFEEFTSDEELIQQDIQNFQQEDWYGYKDEIKNHLVSGVQTQDITVYTADREYYIIAYGLNEDGTVTTEAITRKECTVPDRPEISFTWDAEQIIPIEGGYYSFPYTISNPIEGNELSAIVQYGVTWIDEVEVTESEVRFHIQENTEATDDGALRSSFLTLSYIDAPENKIAYVKQASPLKELSFEIRVVSKTATKATVECSPSDLNATYVFREITMEKYSSYSDEMSLIQDDIASFQQEDWWGNKGEIKDHLVSGLQTQEFSFYSSGREYYIIAYGLNEDGTVTTSKITKEECVLPEKPRIDITWDNEQILPIEGGIYTIPYTVSNPIEGSEIRVDLQWGNDWIDQIEITDSQIRFRVLDNTIANEDGSPRQSFLTISYPDASENKVPIIKQASPIKEN